MRQFIQHQLMPSSAVKETLYSYTKGTAPAPRQHTAPTMHGAIPSSRFIPQGQHFDLATFCAEFISNVCTLFKARAAALQLWPSLCGDQASFYSADSMVENDIRFRYHPGAGWLGWIVHHKQPLLIHDCQDHRALQRITPGWWWYGPYTEGIAACHTYSQYLGAPLCIDQKVIGVIGLLRHRQDVAFMGDDKRSLQGMAEGLAVVVGRLRLQQEHAEHTAALSVITKLHHLNMQKAHPKKGWDIVLQQGLKALGCDAGHIRLLEGNHLRLVADGGYSAKRPSRIRGLRQGVSGWVATHQRALFLGRTTAKRTMCLPLMVDGQILGTLVACKNSGSGLTETQWHWLTNMADSLAMALLPWMPRYPMVA